MAKTIRYRCAEFVLEQGKPVTLEQVMRAIHHPNRDGVREALRLLCMDGYLTQTGVRDKRLYAAVGHLPEEDARGKNAVNFKGARGYVGKPKQRTVTTKVHESPLAQALAWQP